MSQLVSIGSYMDRFGAQLDWEVLKENGIEAFVQADDAGGFAPYLLVSTGGANLMVAVENADRAKDILSVATSDEEIVEPAE